MTYYKAHSIQFNADAQGGVPVNLPDTTDRSWVSNPTIDAEVTAPNLSPTFISQNARKLLGTLSTYSLKDIFDIIGTRGFCIESQTHPGVVWYSEKYDDCGDAQAGAVHRSLTVGNGRVVPDSLEVDHQGNAVLAYRVIPIKVGAPDPIVKSDAAALPTFTIAPARWTIGPLTIGGVALDRYTSMSIDFGNLVEGRSTKSDVDDTFIDHESHSPTMTVRGIDPTWWDTVLPLAGAAMQHADTSWYLRKRAQGGTDFVADGTAEHIKFTMHGLGTLDDLLAGGEIKRPSETSIMLTGSVDSSGTTPLTVNTASAIT